MLKKTIVLVCMLGILMVGCSQGEVQGAEELSDTQYLLNVDQQDEQPVPPDNGDQPPPPPNGDQQPPPPPEGDGQQPPPPQGDGQSPAPPDSNNQPPSGQNQYSVEQAISDRAQETTIAFDALAFMTGDLCADSFLPPGKVSDFFGFQYLRDNDPDEMGHNTTFVPRIANNVLYILSDEQVAQLAALAEEQTPQISALAYNRFVLMDAFRRQLNGDVPAGSTGLDSAAVQTVSAELYRLDGQISYRRAEVLGGIIRSLNADQRAYLDQLAAGGSLSWPEMEEQVDRRTMSPEAHVALTTYASQLYSWYAGSIEADVYFAPERHAMYFGSFYLKDIPAMGNDDYNIGTNLTSDGGEAFLNMLDETQRQTITSLVDIQRADLNEIVETRSAIAAQLRTFMSDPSVDEATVLALAEQYGRLDGEISTYYATHFASVYNTLSDEQKSALEELRNLDGYTCNGAYLYAENIALPEIENSDFLFLQ